jgi:hypothetical protein
LTGQRFGRLTVVGYVGNNNANSQWLCKCDCGKSTTLATSALLRKDKPQKSCGCGMVQRKHGMSGTPEHHAWRSMYQRCNNPNNPQYSLYGGRGISVCPRWRESFENFLADMGPRPGDNYSVDRIDNNKGYSPDNCRWANDLEQSNNTRHNRRITYNGKTHTLTEWSRITGISKSGLRWRLANGWAIADALTIDASYSNGWKNHAASKTK